ncbi:hydroxysqualene dehydroxylase HpnE [Paraburkholderia saeva]|uniref:hydroxysqualene dehydroxylase HpnE n=1 Tax=Paraburkholderia saeva TaxID=2777537 RepID=UPI001DAFEEA2|nr:hydroxysqualene dehydroxylase HpnE [Paraburkholderia saeva]CAG4918175.1 Hydroxysqualene dehydroxylase [Paraburkholderia saeva]
MVKLVHVIGAGVAGLAAAVQLQRRGAQVVLHEAATQAGGRCRSYYDRTLGATIDTGNHLIFSGNQATLAYARAIGAADELVGPADPEFPFMDLASSERWTVKVSPGPLPLWVFDSSARVPNTNWADYFSMLPLLFAKPGRSMAQTMRCNGMLWDRLLGPLFHAVMNGEAREATAQLAGAVARETFAAGGQACRPLVARNGLGSAFVDPALRLLQHGGAQIKLGSRLNDLTFSESGRVASLHFADESIALGANEGMVLAVPPNVAQSIVPGLQAPQRFSAIINVHFAVEPPFGLPPVMGLIGSTAEWLFAFDGRLSVTIYGADRLTGMPQEELVKMVWADVAHAAGLPAEPMPVSQVVMEERATFAAQPDQEMLRPATRTRWNNLMLAGDWTATGLPATIEGAIRSGQKAADLLLNEPMEHR